MASSKHLQQNINFLKFQNDWLVVPDDVCKGNVTAYTRTL